MRWAIAVILLALAANWVLGLDKIDGDTGNPVPSCSAYTEDTCPSWNCATMGNRLCGP